MDGVMWHNPRKIVWRLAKVEMPEIKLFSWGASVGDRLGLCGIAVQDAVESARELFGIVGFQEKIAEAHAQTFPGLRGGT